MSTETGDPGENSLAAAADRVLDNLAELEPELVGAAIFGPEGERIAVKADSERWPSVAAELLAALEAGSGDEDLDSAHVARADGEVFVVKESGLSLVAVTGRFVLASLTSYDMRMALRDLGRGKTTGRAENGGD
ncbi:MAG: hypothetical protein J0H98_10400 [Solirubrobacterales bacterium]|nr:hypothetical protein [Solirubrobacterales bacterium]